MLHPTKPADNADRVSDSYVPITPAHELPGYDEWLDDRARAEAATDQAEADLAAEAEERRLRDELTSDTARSYLIFTASGGMVGPLSTTVRGSSIGAALFTAREAAEYVASHPGTTAARCDCPLCVAGDWHGLAACRQTFAPSRPRAVRFNTPTVRRAA